MCRMVCRRRRAGKARRHGRPGLSAVRRTAYIDPLNAHAEISMVPELDTAREANRLYWDSDTPVADIAQQLELSRRALYDAIRPLPSGTTCDVCGGEMTWENRSARTAGVVVCMQCRAREGAAAEPDDVEHPPEPFALPPLDPRTVRLGGAMIIGAAVGFAATLLAVRR
jgi:hypothetical protein